MPLLRSTLVAAVLVSVVLAAPDHRAQPRPGADAGPVAPFAVDALAAAAADAGADRTAARSLAEAVAQVLDEEAKLIAPDGTENDFFGFSVSLSGSRALVGAPFSGSNGAAYVFSADGTKWGLEQTLTVPDPPFANSFGHAVSLSGNRALIGDPRDNNDRGAVYVFAFDGTTWSLQQTLTDSDGDTAADRFGYSVSLAGDRALIGVPNDDNAAGSAYVFAFDGATWGEPQKLVAGDRATQDYFGESVSLSGARALVGAYWDDDLGTNSGAAYVFAFDGAAWSQQAKLTADDGAAQDYFGESVSLSGARALIGAARDDDLGFDSGSAYVFAFDGTTWSQQAKLTADDGAVGDSFGSAVSLDRDRALVGAERDDGATGSAYVFVSGDAAWSQQAKLTAGDGAVGDSFGSAVSLDGNRALVGARLDNDNGSASGSAYVFRLGPGPIVVTDTRDLEDTDDTDDRCDADPGEAGDQCTLRAAIRTANARAGRDSVSFAIDGAGLHQIDLGSALPPATDPLVLDATTQPGYSGTPRVTVTGTAPFGLALGAGSSTVRGLALGGFANAAIAITGPGDDRVEACHLGVDAAGTAALPNAVGVFVADAPNVRIGGTTAARRNVISGNTTVGVTITGASAGAVVLGNFIGTGAAGTAALPNGIGVQVASPDVTVGGPAASARNVISGNTTAGVVVTADGDGATVQGNYIGLAVGGADALGNGTDADPAAGHVGVLIGSAGGVTIGGPTATPGAAPGNVIAASGSAGIYAVGRLNGDGPSDNLRVVGNLIGTDASGAAARPNGATGVHLAGAVRNARIGQAGGGNVVVAQDSSAVVLEDLGAGVGAPDGARVVANTIGMTASASAVLGRQRYGIETRTTGGIGRGVQNVTVGGAAAGEGNRIRARFGVLLRGRRSTGAVVAQNTVGLLASGQIAEPDSSRVGIWTLFADGAQITGNTVGGQVVGVLLASDQNTVTANRIGTDPAGTSARPNTIGVWISRSVVGRDGAHTDVGDGHTVGARGQGNVISGSRLNGVLIGLELDLEAVGSGRFATQDVVPAFAGRIGPGSPPRRAAPAAERGGGGTPNGNVVAFNRIGTNAEGTVEIGNGRAEAILDAASGVEIQSGVGNAVIGNLISGNGAGVVVQPESEDVVPDATRIEGNVIGGSAMPGATIPNLFGGIEVEDATHTAIGAAVLEPGGPPVGNRIVGNAGGDLAGQGVRKLTAEFTTVRQTSFEGNTGESIERLSYEDGSLDPEYPDVFVAAAGADAVAYRLTPDATGPVDVFVSPDCTDGIADGAYVLSVDGTDGIALDVPLSPGALGVPSAAAAVGLYVAATNTTTGTSAATSEFSDCLRIAAAGDVAEAPVEDGQTGPVLDDVGLTVEVTTNPASPSADGRRAAGTLYAARYALAPQGGAVEGSATSPDGTTVAPNAVSSNRYWTLRADGLGGITYTACLDTDGVGGILVPGQLVVVHRTRAGTPWTARASTLDGTRLCAAGLSEVGELGIGADSTVNPVPAEPGPGDEPQTTVPAALALSAFPNPTRGAATLTLALPSDGRVRVEVVDALGRRVAVLADLTLGAGTHALAFDASSVPAGVYIVRATSADAVVAQSLTVVR